jgi:2-polyprenyl-3-methyl-5-hydroxy-6-metoxy-1,4-benzoquinol methylase
LTGAPARCIACGAEPRPRFAQGGTRIVGCPACGLEWRTPFPTEEELARLYGADYFARWGPARGADPAVRAAKEATYGAFLGALPARVAGGRLLDVGCALGYSVGVARARGFDAYGLDRNAEAIAHARGELGDRVHDGPLDARAFPGLRFDVFTLIDVLEHVPAPAALLGVLAGRLAPGGVVLAVLPNAASLVRRALGRRWPHYAPEHLYLWTPTALRHFSESNEWRVARLETGVRKTFTAAYLKAYSEALGGWLPPGLGLLGTAPFRAPTGELLVVLERAGPASAGAVRPAP